MQHDKQSLIELVTRAQDGDQTAFDELYEQLYQPLFRYIAAKVRTTEDAEDLTQQSFLKFYKNLSRWQDRGYSPTAYLYKIASSVVIDYYRATRNRPIGDSEDVLLAIADTSQDQHQDVLIHEQKQHLLNQLHKLSELDQEVLRLRFFVGLSSEQIAEIIGKTPVATRKLQSRAVAKLRLLIKDEERP